MLCSTKSADSLAELSEINNPLLLSFQILTMSEQVCFERTPSEPPFTQLTKVSCDGDLFLLLTFCQNILLVLSACSAAASPLALCIKILEALPQ